jgi:hypothetical protein
VFSHSSGQQQQEQPKQQEQQQQAGSSSEAAQQWPPGVAWAKESGNGRLMAWQYRGDPC